MAANGEWARADKAPGSKKDKRRHCRLSAREDLNRAHTADVDEASASTSSSSSVSSSANSVSSPYESTSTLSPSSSSPPPPLQPQPTTTGRESSVSLNAAVVCAAPATETVVECSAVSISVAACARAAIARVLERSASSRSSACVNARVKQSADHQSSGGGGGGGGASKAYTAANRLLGPSVTHRALHVTDIGRTLKRNLVAQVSSKKRKPDGDKTGRSGSSAGLLVAATSDNSAASTPHHCAATYKETSLQTPIINEPLERDSSSQAIQAHKRRAVAARIHEETRHTYVQVDDTSGAHYSHPSDTSNVSCELNMNRISHATAAAHSVDTIAGCQQSETCTHTSACSSATSPAPSHCVDFDCQQRLSENTRATSIIKDNKCNNASEQRNDNMQQQYANATQTLNSDAGQPCNSASKVLAKSTTTASIVKRDNWDKNIEFLLAVIGFAVDLGNVWRFPYICYKNGGGAFLIPYTIMFVFGGLPIFYLEMSLGQYFSSGCLTVWRRVCPMAKGIGYAMCVLNFYTGLYYNTIISWAVFFFVESFARVLPWSSCDRPWNQASCRTIEQRHNDTSRLHEQTAALAYNTSSQYNLSALARFTSPTQEYFEREVLGVNNSKGINDLGPVRAPLAIYLAIVFVCIYFAIWKGVKSTGKAVWITALLPYFVLIPLLVRGVFLDGAWLGIRYYLYPEWSRILDPIVWVDAATQIYFSLGPGFGTLMALSSYNRFHHNCHRDALIAAGVNYFASFISGLVIFAVLGYMSTLQNVSIDSVATDGPGLVFQVYPEGLATMSFASLWAVLFFIMVITLGIDSTFGGLESVITGLCDEYPRVLRANRGIFIGCLISFIYICSLPTTTLGGQYVINLVESYGTSLSLLFIVSIETIIVCWLYGANRFCDNLQEMSGKRPHMYWYICWKYISPTLLVIIFFARCRLEWGNYHTLIIGGYKFPDWAPGVGLLMTGSSIFCVPLYAVYYLKTKVKGSFMERLKMAIKPIQFDDQNDHKFDKIREDNTCPLDTVI